MSSLQRDRHGAGEATGAPRRENLRYVQGMQRQRTSFRLMFGSTKSLLMWIAGALVAAVIAILSVIFAMDVYLALQDPAEPVPVPIEDRR
ncbi:hypothetical protein [Bradyrhizobium sp.]|uniref:hypothetical protein n=1 Tax=Bradyrhizobium sp. TaxID=376 RepID=UPI003C1F18C3